MAFDLVVESPVQVSDECRPWESGSRMHFWEPVGSCGIAVTAGEPMTFDLKDLFDKPLPGHVQPVYTSYFPEGLSVSDDGVMQGVAKWPGRTYVYVMLSNGIRTFPVLFNLVVREAA